MSSEAEATLIDRSPWKLRGRGHLPGIASIAVLLALTAVPIRSVLANSLDMQNCYKDDDQSFAACNTIIDDPTAPQHDRSQALVGRGDSWDNVKHDHDPAVADYTQAIEIDPNNAVAFYNRGLTWIRKGDDQRAIADFDEAIRLDPKNATPFSTAAMSGERKAISITPSPTMTKRSVSIQIRKGLHQSRLRLA